MLALAAFGVVRLVTADERAFDAAAQDILNPHPAAGPFEPDDTSVEDCAEGSDDGRACYEQAFGNLAYREGGRRALAAMTERGTVEPEVSSGCHRIAHAIGAAVLARKGGEISAALADGDSTCWSGFYHGLLERGLAPARSASELRQLIGTLCEPPEGGWSSFVRYQCLHGIGHGLMLRTGNALEASLELCSSLHDQWSRQSCDGGVFMERFSPSLDDAPVFDASDPLAPCPTVAEAHKLYCYLQVADNLVRGLDYEWEAVAAACGTETAPTWREICFQGYGRQASGTNYGTPAAVADLCSVAGGEGESGCVYGAARDIASNAASGEPAAVFCRLLAAGLQARCFEGVGTIVATLETDQSTVRDRCAALAGAHRPDCLRGAGLPA